MRHLFFSVIILLFVACGSKNEINVHNETEMVGLGSPFTLPADSGIFNLQDYILNLNLIDSVTGPSELKLNLSSNKQFLSIAVIEQPQALSVLNIWVKGIAYAVILKRSAKQIVEYTFNPAGSLLNSVQLAGDINNWQPGNTNLSNENGIWKTELILNPGKYSYQLVRDGKWSLDPANNDSTSNGMGGYNSILTVLAPGEETLPFIFTESHNEKQIVLGSENQVESWIVLWENYQIPSEMLKIEGEKLSISLPKNAQKTERSAIRVFAYNKSGYSNDVFIPLHNGKVLQSISEIKRDDFHSSVLYFAMVDRFFDGDTSINKPLNDPRVDFKADYQGGDLKGITKKIKEGYFKALGINTIWVSPIVQNPEGAFQEYPSPRRWFSGYHGYWPVSSTKVDHRFGDEKALKELVDVAHENDMNVLMDFVSNHIHNEHPIYKIHPEWFSSMYTPDGRVNIRIWDEFRLTTWFDDFMPDIDFTKPEAINAFSDSAIYWITKYNLDGFRHDATKHVSEDFWRVLTRKMKQEVIKKSNKNIYQIGETFGSRELIGDYIGSGMLDAQFDFNLYFDARPVFASDAESFEKVSTSLKESMRYYGYHSLMGNITGNHDMPRFISYAGAALKDGEDEKEAGWSRSIEVEDKRGYDRLKMLTAFMMAIPGVPIIYYGDEIGMPGAGDPDNRRMMRFDNLAAEELDVKKDVSIMTKLRKSNLSLMYGSTRVLYASENQLVILRHYFDSFAVLTLNRSAQEESVEFELPAYIQASGIKTTFGNPFHSEGNKLKIQLPSLSFDFIVNEL